jgi:capsular exopolysaccharide synthesis family protein
MANVPENRSMTPLPASNYGAPAANGARPPAGPVAPTPAAVSTVPPALTGPPGLDTLFNVLRCRGPVVAVACLLAGLLGAAGVWVAVPERQMSQTKVQVTLRTRPGEEVDPTSAQKAQVAFLKSDKVLDTAAGNLAALYGGQSKDELKAWLQKDLAVEFPFGTETLVISLTGDRPDLLRPALDEVLAAYRDEVNGKEKIRIEERLKALREKHAKVAVDLRQKRYDLARRKSQLNIKDGALVQTELGAALNRLSTVQMRRKEAQLRRIQAAHELEEVRAQLEGPRWFLAPLPLRISPLDIEKEINASTRMKALEEARQKIDAEIDEIRRVAGVNPDKAALERKLQEPNQRLLSVDTRIRETRREMTPAIEAQLRETLRTELRRRQFLLERAVKDSEDAERQLENDERIEQAKVNDLYGATRPSDQASSEVNALEDAVVQAERTYTVIGNEIGQLEAETVTTNRVLILEAPSAPGPAKNDKRYKIVGASFLGVFGLVFLAFAFVEFVRKPLRRPEEVSRGLALPVLGTVPEMPPAAQRPLLADAGASPEQAAALEAVDAVRASVLYAARTEPLHVLLVTSPKRGEGKTSLAGHLAASLARSWRNVLLIDGDLRQPSLHGLFDLPQGPGFAEVLRGEIDLDEVVQSTSLARLSVLPAGRGDRIAIEALSQSAVGEQLARLKEDFEFVIIDVGPVLESADALQLGQYADAVILSAQRDVSRLGEVHAARERLEGVGIRVLGAVVGGGKVSGAGFTAAPRG